MPEITLTRVSGYRRSHWGRDNAPFIRSMTHAPDQEEYGLDFSIARSISPLSTTRDYSSARRDFHAFSRARWALNGKSVVEKTQTVDVPLCAKMITANAHQMFGALPSNK